MKTEKNILVAFILNLSFSLFEFVGGIFVGSIAIVSDAIHDVGDAISIGISYILEKKSKKQPDEKHTYGYVRYSVLGSAVTTAILLVGSIAVIINAMVRIFNPVEIDYDGMVIFAVVGVLVNFVAAFVTREGNSLNQKAVNLHMLEDVLGWIVVLIGAIVMKFTDFVIVDPLMSIGVSIFILVNAINNFKQIINLFVEKTPENIDINNIKEHLMEIDGVMDVHHIHIWSIDGQNNYATMHIVTDADFEQIKSKVRRELHEHGIVHVTIELEGKNESCHEKNCHTDFDCASCGHHHHHH